ncbi:MAG: trigger factor [Clostridia bacterium]|nr:trigger factor [Clostridia bacterium]
MSLVSANKTDTNIYTIEISVSAEDFAAAVQKSYLKNRKSIQIPGFRKGKAPRQMIERLYGKDFFYEDALEAIFPEEIENAYKEADITPVDQPKDLDIKYMDVEQGANFTVKVTVKPEITVKAYKGLEAEKAEVSVSEEDIDREIDFMLDRGSRIVDVDDRAVQDGDITVIDFEGFVDGVAFEGGKGENYNLTIGSGQFIPGFEEQIIGHSIGEEFDINVTFPENYAEELASKDAVFKIKLKEIKVKQLPELDDEFAKDQDYDTVAEMREGVKTDLLAHKEEHAQRDFEDAVIAVLCDNVEGEIPEVMYDNKAQESVQQFANRVSQQGLDFETYLMYMGMDLDTFKANMRERAVNEVKYELAVEKIAELENITIDDEAIEEEYKKMAENYDLDVEKIKEIVASDVIANQLKIQQAAKLVIDSAVAKAPEAKAEEKKDEDAE